MQKFENNWKQKSIENLEKSYWGDPPQNATGLVEMVHKLRSVSIESLEPEHIRLLISQDVGLAYVIPIALDLLEAELFLDTSLYPGDLLRSVIRVSDSFWDTHTELRSRLDNLLKTFSNEDKENFANGKFANYR